MAGVRSGYPRLSSRSHPGSSPAVVAVDNPPELSLGVGSGAERISPVSPAHVCNFDGDTLGS